MNIALLGKGKTGQHVLKLAENRYDKPVTVCDTERPVSAERLESHDVVISFLPGEAFEHAIPHLIASRVPVITGSTGFEWPEGRQAFSDMLAREGLTWIHANNFSLGMNLIREMIRMLGKADRLYPDCWYSLHEVHHARKKDRPSGTALAWKQWLDQPVEITSERTGDVVGEHRLMLHTAREEITLGHKARDRAIFADGALWAAEQLLAGNLNAGPGLHDFQQQTMDLLLNR